jgi:hypothetical protein
MEGVSSSDFIIVNMSEQFSSISENSKWEETTMNNSDVLLE